MIQKLRKKFISITAAVLFLLIFLVIAAINVIFVLQTNRMLDSRLDMILGEPHAPQGGSDIRRDKRNPFIPRLDGGLRIHPDGCLLILAPDGSVKEIKEDAGEKYSSEDLEAIAGAVYRRGSSHGWDQYF